MEDVRNKIIPEKSKFYLKNNKLYLALFKEVIELKLFSIIFENPYPIFFSY